MNVTTNYNEFLIIEDYLRSIDIPIASLDNFPKTNHDNDRTTLDEPITIDPKSSGPLAPIFTEITLNIWWNTWETGPDRITRLCLDYSYKHPSGSNGYAVHLYSVNGSDLGDYESTVGLLSKK